MTNKNFFASLNLTPQARTLLAHMERTGSISAREAMADYGITSAVLTRRICDMQEKGVVVVKERRTHKITGRNYTRYSLGAPKLEPVIGARIRVIKDVGASANIGAQGTLQEILGGEWGYRVQIDFDETPGTWPLARDEFEVIG
ncbi:helix-turn-helix domain-containing protein [Bosea sp. RCC_152_1]|uniref:helix-turn-helix domain-containing protein n=1 Tax=Bosea sp. RCC_152_1 TaxID=3239228 RepID=UPI00352524DE